MSDEEQPNGAEGHRPDDSVGPTSIATLLTMSTTHQTTLSESLRQLENRERRLQPEHVHERYLWTNPETCNECYARLRTIEEFERNAWGDVAREVDLTEDAVRGWDDDAGESSMHPATFCRICGGRGHAHPETDSKRQAVRRAYRIAERLEEQDIPVDAVAMTTAVRKLKSYDEIQGMDREIYARATKLAVQRGRR